MDGSLENKWLKDSSCSRHMTGNKKWFSSLIPLSHKEYVTFGDDKKGKVLGTDIIKVNDYFTLNDVVLVDKLRYNSLSVSQLVNADLDVLFHKSGSQVLDSSLSLSMLIWMFSFGSQVHKFLILLASAFVAFLTSEKSFKLISHLLNLL
jgi:hypothetical protein